MSPMSLFHHKDFKSNLSKFDDVAGHGFDKQGTRFKNLMKDMEEGISRLFFALVYYEQDDERKKRDRKDVAICRVEQLCPFPYALVQRAKTISKAQSNNHICHTGHCGASETEIAGEAFDDRNGERHKIDGSR